MKIPAWLSLSYKITLFVLTAIVTSASASPDYFGGTVVAHMIGFWVAFAATIISGVGTIVGTGNQPSLTVVGKVE